MHKTGTAPIGTAYLYTGQRWDDLLGLYDYNARWYDPGTGRFVSADTIVPDITQAQAHNRYTYVVNGPLRYIDPTGHTACNPSLQPATVQAQTEIDGRVADDAIQAIIDEIDEIYSASDLIGNDSLNAFLLGLAVVVGLEVAYAVIGLLAAQMAGGAVLTLEAAVVAVGSAALAGLLVFAAIALIAGIGWAVYYTTVLKPAAEKTVEIRNWLDANTRVNDNDFLEVWDPVQEQWVEVNAMSVTYDPKAQKLVFEFETENGPLTKSFQDVNRRTGRFFTERFEQWEHVA